MVDESKLLSELQFKTSKSSGPGGQHVNKTSSKVELSFDLKASKVFDENQKELLISNLKSRFTKDHFLILKCDESRSQHKNKELVTDRFFEIIYKGLSLPKERKKTKLPKAIKIKRLKEKRQLAEKKASRKPPGID